MKLHIRFLIYFHTMCLGHFIDDVIEREFEPIIITSKLSRFIEFAIPTPNVAKTVVNIKMFKPNGDIIIGKPINKYFNTISKCVKEALVLKKCFKTVLNDKIQSYYESIVKIGPLKESDHGNWLVSSEFQNINGSFVEFFRIITVVIIETVPTYPLQVYLNPGDTYKIGLKENISNLSSCEIQAPKYTFDRYYERDLKDLEFCNYIIPDVKSQDDGVWKIVAVGKIVFVGHGRLYVTK